MVVDLPGTGDGDDDDGNYGADDYDGDDKGGGQIFFLLF